MLSEYRLEQVDPVLTDRIESDKNTRKDIEDAWWDDEDEISKAPPKTTVPPVESSARK